MRDSRKQRVGAAVEVVADHVPPAAPAHDAPRLQPPGGRGVVLGHAVVERDRLRGPGPRSERPERRVDGHHRLDAEGGVRVDVDPGGAQFRRPDDGGRGQPGVLPQPGRDADRRRLVRLEVHVGQRVVAAGDPVARLGVEDAGGAGLQRHAELAQFGLVPLELALERLVLPRVVGVVLVSGHGAAICAAVRKRRVDSRQMTRLTRRSVRLRDTCTTIDPRALRGAPRHGPARPPEPGKCCRRERSRAPRRR